MRRRGIIEWGTDGNSLFKCLFYRGTDLAKDKHPLPLKLTQPHLAHYVAHILSSP